MKLKTLAFLLKLICRPYKIRVTIYESKHWSVIRLWVAGKCVLDISPTIWGYVLMADAKRINIPTNIYKYQQCVGRYEDARTLQR